MCMCMCLDVFGSTFFVTFDSVMGTVEDHFFGAASPMTLRSIVKLACFLGGLDVHSQMARLRCLLMYNIFSVCHFLFGLFGFLIGFVYVCPAWINNTVEQMLLVDECICEAFSINCECLSNTSDVMFPTLPIEQTTFPGGSDCAQISSYLCPPNSNKLSLTYV